MDEPTEITVEMRNAAKLISRLWRENNKEKMRESRKKWYEAHKNTDEYKEKTKTYNKKYYQDKKLIKETTLDKET